MCVIIGAGGFLATHLALYLLQTGASVIGLGTKLNSYIAVPYTTFFNVDATNYLQVLNTIPQETDEVYQLASKTYSSSLKENRSADMWAAELQINLNVLQACVIKRVKSVFYPSSYSVYRTPSGPEQKSYTESDIYPAYPESEHGWRKLSCERLYQAFQQQYGLHVRIARCDNIFGPYGHYDGPAEKLINSLSRRIHKLPKQEGNLSITGDGTTQRQFLYVKDWVLAVVHVMRHKACDTVTTCACDAVNTCDTIVNISALEPTSLNTLVDDLANIAQKTFTVQHCIGYQGYASKVCTIDKLLSTGWLPTYSLQQGLTETYRWVQNCIDCVAEI